MSDLNEALKYAMSLDVHDRAALAENLLASLERSEIYREDLLANWKLAVEGQQPFKIEPLR